MITAKTRYMKLQEQIDLLKTEQDEIRKKTDEDLRRRRKEQEEYRDKLANADLQFIKDELKKRHPLLSEMPLLSTIQYLQIARNQNLDRECFDILNTSYDVLIAKQLLNNSAICVEWKCELIKKYKCL